MSIQLCHPQEFNVFSEPIVEVSSQLSPKYTIKFGIENRNVLLKDDELEYTVKHLQFTHFSNYKLGDTKSIGFGMQYRFQRDFDSSKENEFRLQQQFQFGKKDITHRFRTEQRLYDSYSNYRFRYQIGYQFVINNHSKAATSLDISTESLLEIGLIKRPELEHRVTITYNVPIHSTIDIELGAQYRLSDYSNDLTHELFMITSLTIEL